MKISFTINIARGRGAWVTRYTFTLGEVVWAATCIAAIAGCGVMLAWRA